MSKEIAFWDWPCDYFLSPCTAGVIIGIMLIGFISSLLVGFIVFTYDVFFK